MIDLPFSEDFEPLTIETLPALRQKSIEETDETKALRVELGLDSCRLRPFSHQVLGANFIVTHPFCALFDEMGAGKTLQTIIAACVLYLRGELDRLIIVAPASVRAVWFDEEIGELAKHLWESVFAEVIEYHGRERRWLWGAAPVPDGKKRLQIIVTNYELIRQKPWLDRLLPFATKRTMLVLDESSMVKNWKSEQTKACRELRKRVGRIVLLNGTPIADSPLDMFAQGNIMSPDILECPFITHFKSKYAQMGGYVATTKWGARVPTQVIGWQNLEELQQRFAPYVLRRLKRDCLDLPEKLPSVTLTATLDESWPHYKAMRDDMVAWLGTSNVSLSLETFTKIMRLAQITSGFLGGVEDFDDEDPEGYDRPEWMPPAPESLFEDIAPANFKDTEVKAVKEISREKLDVLINFTREQLQAEKNLKLLVWCRFKPEVERNVRVFRELFPSMEVGVIRGGQKKKERIDAMKLLDPRFTPNKPVTVFSTSAGARGSTLVASHTVVRMSRDYRLDTLLQADDRVHRMGQEHAISYFDIVAEGPKGQRTIDLDILHDLLKKNDIATWTTSAWVDRLVSA